MENTKRKKRRKNQEEKTMRNFNAQNKVNNVKGSKKAVPMIIAAIVTIAGAATLLTGCGTDVPASSAPAANVAVTTSASTTAASAKNDKAENKTTTAVNNAQAEQTSAKAADIDTTAASSANADKIGIDRETAIANVRELVGSGAQILSCEKGAAPDTGFACWVIEVVPVTKDNGPDKVTYYSGYQFCYPYNNASEATASDGQNPMMNFIGNYTNGRAMMTVNCISQTEACIDISWGSSACETTIWKMSGTVSSSNEGVTVTYSNCTKQHFTYTEDGQLISDDIEYENGTGSVDFLAADNNAYWYDAVEGAGAGTSFWYCN